MRQVSRKLYIFWVLIFLFFVTVENKITCFISRIKLRRFLFLLHYFKWNVHNGLLFERELVDVRLHVDDGWAGHWFQGDPHFDWVGFRFRHALNCILVFLYWSKVIKNIFCHRHSVRKRTIFVFMYD